MTKKYVALCLLGCITSASLAAGCITLQLRYLDRRHMAQIKTVVKPECLLK